MLDSVNACVCATRRSQRACMYACACACACACVDARVRCACRANAMPTIRTSEKRGGGSRHKRRGREMWQHGQQHEQRHEQQHVHEHEEQHVQEHEQRHVHEHEQQHEQQHVQEACRSRPPPKRGVCGACQMSRQGSRGAEHGHAGPPRTWRAQRPGGQSHTNRADSALAARRRRRPSTPPLSCPSCHDATSKAVSVAPC
mmetsp:Transcript_3069/g.5994  ORF Transcript_3069/g.5994 Transcript_3069/m.5994 type:complete len:200 (-) Transcript_3069:86-685(-)